MQFETETLEVAGRLKDVGQVLKEFADDSSITVLLGTLTRSDADSYLLNVVYTVTHQDEW